MRFSWLAVCVLVVTVCSVGVQADVTGTFNLEVTMFPQGIQTEAVRFDIDLMSNLQFNSTFSGITLGADLGFGVTGVEFSILKLTANLGALTLREESVFAVPFGCAPFAAGVGDGPDAPGPCPGNHVVPVGDADGNGTIDDNAIAFVKNRTEVALNVGGVTIGNLLLVEDVDFPDLQGGDDHEHDHFNGAVAYDVYGINSQIDDQTPTWGAGDVLFVSGQTVSGVTVASETAFCAAGRNYIKKRHWAYEVNKKCAILDLGFVIEGGGSPFALEEQRFWIKGLGGEGLLMDLHTALSPLERTFNGTVTVSYTISELASLLVSVDLHSGGTNTLVAAVTSGNAVITLTDVGMDLDIDAAVGVFSFILNPNSNPLDFGVRLEADQKGFAGFELSLGFSQGLLRVATTTRFDPNPAINGFAWAFTSFKMSGNTNMFNFGADFSFSQDGISATNASLGFLF